MSTGQNAVMDERNTRARRTHLGAWLAIICGVVLTQVGVIALVTTGVEADLNRTVGAPPLWQPAALAVGLAMLGGGVVGLLRHRQR